MGLDGCKMRLIGIAETLGIPKEIFGHMTQEHLDIRKLCGKWMPQELIIRTMGTASQINQNDDKIAMNGFQPTLRIWFLTTFSCPRDVFFLFSDLERILVVK